MARIIVVTSGKGGVGKTSIVANVGSVLAAQDYKVCLIDADLGLKNLDVVLGIESRVIYDLQDVIENRCELEQAIIKDKRNNNLFVLPACKNLDVSKIDYLYLQRIINKLEQNYDFVIIDCPAGIERGFFNAIKNAKEAIVVATLNISSIRDADKVIGILASEGILDTKLIINKMNPSLIEDEISLDLSDALDVLSIPLLGVVYDDLTVVANSNHGNSVIYDKKSLASKCYYNIAMRLQGKTVERVKYKKKSLLARIFS